ncbi:GGDEF domain-containing protein [[Eubacterium] hominis]|uniref:GGDEF domain-containing protein n=1 Tax=[Eubacterium] hominis TaxID=2764325 RepID=UPI003A4DF499
MNFVYEMIVVLQVIIMNLYIFKKNVKRCYPKIHILIVLFCYSFMMIMIGVYVIKALGIYGNGNGLFTVFGFFYLLPLHKMYEGSLRQHFFILCFAWSYTLSVFIISVQLAYACFTYLTLSFCVMIIQTVFFIITYRGMDWFMTQIYRVLMECHHLEMQRKLNITSLLWLVSILLINVHFIYDKIVLIKLMTIIVLIINACYTFVLLNDILIKGDQIGLLENKILKDTLTGLGSRLAFDREMDKKIQERQPFYFIYMDLDDFKKINDEYGHLTGDQYLIAFSNKMKEIKKTDMIFRISGDEFVMLISEVDIEKILDQIRRIQFVLPKSKAKFKGVSFGVAHYPTDGVLLDELISFADERMYERKKTKKLMKT